VTPELQNAIQAVQLLSPKELLQLLGILANILQDSPLLETVREEQPQSIATEPFRRIPALHAGSIEITPDFDAPLPDKFWLGTL
jgi:hypothetical protein